ncbi:hypothetical protein BD289DRAFT_428813 [Coniella lustricola]|uniref:DNA polymerase epsilon subunit D n=1 Tax=Coniella lustricola TaxID=2025994 RepID=A0A2T3ADP4_9PEZI|nr:hypothetical protein BD289DRAFT_428813 [Coniella lustricola]
MPSRKSDSHRKSDASASFAKLVPIEDSTSPSPAAASMATGAGAGAGAAAAVSAVSAPPQSQPSSQPQLPQHQPPVLAPALAPAASAPGSTSAPSASSALALPTMDTSMPPPSLPPPGSSSQNPGTVAHFAPRMGSTSAAGVGGGASLAPLLPAVSSSDKGKEKEEKSGPGGHPKEAITIPIEELQLPKSIITRLAKGVLPPNTQIQANAILAMTKSATVFINHLANAANEITALQSKKTIMPADVFRALDDIEYGFMRERVEAEFKKFNETQTTKRSAYRKKVAATKKTSKGSEEGDGGADIAMAGTDGDSGLGGADNSTITSAAESATGPGGGGAHRAKKARTDADAKMMMDVDEELNDASDPESMPEEEEEEDEDEDAQADEEEEEEDEEEDEEEEGEEGQGGAEGEDQDALEEREEQPDDDEALDDGNHSD